MPEPTDADLNALDVTDAEAAEINRIAHPLSAEPTNENPALVDVESTPEGAVFVTLNRPQKKNAFDAATIAALREAFETLHGADHVRIVFVRGAGGTFSAGADLAWMRDAVEWSEAENRDDAMGLATMLKALHDVPALTVALVEGAAMGGGAGLVAACDMAIAVKDAKFAFSEVRLGLIPATIAPYVVAAVGPRTAKALFATARVFGAEEALGWGLVSEVVADVQALQERVQALADGMRACAPGAVGDSKRLVDLTAGQRIDHGLMEETARRIARARISPEGQEGVRAFVDKRKPVWAE